MIYRVARRRVFNGAEPRHTSWRLRTIYIETSWHALEHARAEARKLGESANEWQQVRRIGGWRSRVALTLHECQPSPGGVGLL